VFLVIKSIDWLTVFTLFVSELRLTFEDSKQISKSLNLVADSIEKTVTRKRRDGLTHYWFPEPAVYAPPVLGCNT